MMVDWDILKCRAVPADLQTYANKEIINTLILIAYGKISLGVRWEIAPDGVAWNLSFLLERACFCLEM